MKNFALPNFKMKDFFLKTIFVIIGFLSFNTYACPGGHLTLFKDGEVVVAILNKTNQLLEVNEGYQLVDINPCTLPAPNVDSFRPAQIDVSCYYSTQTPIKVQFIRTNHPSDRALVYEVSFNEMTRIYRGCGQEVKPRGDILF